MTESGSGAQAALVTGAFGQDGALLVDRLAREGFRVHAVVRPASRGNSAAGEPRESVEVHEVDVRDDDALAHLVSSIRPDELYNLAGLSSVSASFADPTAAWRTNAAPVASLLEAVRRFSPETRFYQASSSEMFGWVPGGAARHNENAPLLPRSPYASAKAAAHLLCCMYRQAYGLRIACGILFNHESRRRGPSFLTRKVVDHVRMLQAQSGGADPEPLTAGNLKARRDWGFAPDYIDGMCRILRQVRVRAEVSGTSPEPDVAGAYRDYVLGTGQSQAVWELIDRTFHLAGFELDWDLSGDDPVAWCARFRSTNGHAVRVDASLLRPSDPLVIEADAARARRELGWSPRVGLDFFLEDMLADSLRDAGA